MNDSSDGTFATAASGDSSKANLFSFKELDKNDIKIQRVTAMSTAKADGGYLSLVWADSSKGSQDYSKAPAAISVKSNSFSKYEYVWEKNPVTQQAWTPESLGTFLAGYTFAGGNSVEVSEFSRVVTYTANAPAAVAQDAQQVNSTDTESK
jgi:hypothetical protein